MEFSFLYPKFLMLFFLVPFFVFVYFFSIVYNKKRAVMFSNFEAMERFYDIEFFSKNFLALYVNLAVLVLLILALAGTSVSFVTDASTFSYVIAVDVSSSMSTSDVTPNRLAVAKLEAKNFVDLLPIGVDIGVIEFSGDVRVLQPMASSKLKAKMAIDSIDFGQVQGTNIYDAMVSANKLFGSTNRKSIILISDGQSNIGDTPRILKYISRNNLVVNTIAVGTEKGGETKYNTISKVDKDFLKALAFNSGGKFFMVKSSDDFYDSFDSLIHKANKKVTLDLTFYLLISAILLFSILWVLYNLRFKVVP